LPPAKRLCAAHAAAARRSAFSSAAVGRWPSRFHFWIPQISFMPRANKLSRCRSGVPRYRNRSTVSPVFCSRKARSSSGAAPVSSSLSQSWPWFFPRMSTR